MMKVSIKNLKEGDRIKADNGAFEATISKIEPLPNGLYFTMITDDGDTICEPWLNTGGDQNSAWRI